MRKFIYLFSFTILFFMGGALNAQDPMGLYHMQTIPQSSFINPAMMPRAHGFVALPSFNQNFKSDIAFKNLIQEQGNEWVTPLHKNYDFTKLKNATGKSLNISESTDIGLFGFGFRTGGNYFTVNMSIKNVVQGGIPYDLISIADKGFPSGKTFDFSSLQIKSYSYKELALGYSREWNEKLTLGVKVKPLFGMASGTTDIKTIELKTARDLWKVRVDGKISTSAPIEVIEAQDTKHLPDSVKFKDMEDDDWIDYLSSFDNMGLAFDFGGIYKYSPRWTFSVAVVNLGYINWKRDVNTLSFDGSYDFEGLYVEGIDGDIDTALDELENDVRTLIDYKLSHKKFTTGLTPEVYAGALYEVSPSFSMGLLSRSMFQKNNFRQDFNLSANVQPYSFVSFNLNYSIRPRGGSGLGTGLAFLLGPLQIYALADYIPARYSTVYMDGDDFIMMPHSRNLSVKMGLNLVFGRHGYRNSPMLARDR